MNIEVAKKNFLWALSWARLRKGWTQADLARELNMQQSAIARIESGRGNPSLKTLIKITEKLDVNLMLEYRHGKNPHHR